MYDAGQGIWAYDPLVAGICQCAMMSLEWVAKGGLPCAAVAASSDSSASVISSGLS